MPMFWNKEGLKVRIGSGGCEHGVGPGSGSGPRTHVPLIEPQAWSLHAVAYSGTLFTG